MDNFAPDMSEKLVQYLDGELTGVEKEDLEKQLATDKSLQNELSNLKSTTGAIKLYGLKNRVSGIHLEMMEEMQQPVKKLSSARKLIRYSIGVAASLIILIVGYMAYNFNSLSADKVFASGYQAYELVTVRDGNTTETAVQRAYREKKFTEVLRIHDAGEDRTPTGEFLCGTAAMELKNDNKAIKCFNEVLDADKQLQSPVLKDEAEYYLSLSLIRNKNYDEALDLLTKIQADSKHLYHDKATSKMIRQVKRLKGN